MKRTNLLLSLLLPVWVGGCIAPNLDGLTARMGQIEDTMRITVPMVTELAKTSNSPDKYLALAEEFEKAANDVNAIRTEVAALPIRDANDVATFLDNAAAISGALTPTIPQAGILGVLLAGGASIARTWKRKV